jgi:hypothetical protein
MTTRQMQILILENVGNKLLRGLLNMLPVESKVFVVRLLISYTICTRTLLCQFKMAQQNNHWIFNESPLYEYRFLFLARKQVSPFVSFLLFSQQFCFSVIFAFVRLWTNRVKLLLKKPPRYSIALHSISHIHTHTHTLHSISFSLSHTRSFVRWLHL